MLVYDMNDLEGIVSLSQEWVSLIQEANNQIPVIIIANKLDLVIDNPQKHSMTEIRKNMTMLFKRFKQLELGMECTKQKP